jgi:hypothetical protein
MSIERRPWMLDQHDYPVVTSMDGAHPVITKFKRNEFYKNKIHSKFIRLLRHPQYAQWRCFITGGQCYLAQNYRRSGCQLQWSLSQEHLSASKLMEREITNDTNTVRNIVPVAAFINQTFGHMPLAIKILIRRHLETMAYDRDDYSTENCFKIRKMIYDFKDELKIGNYFPWQPWAYSGGPEKEMAREFYNRAVLIDAEFLELKTYEDCWNFINHREIILK